MGAISERLILQCPINQATPYLAAFITTHRADDGAVRVPLRVPLDMFGRKRALAVHHITATLYPLHATGDMRPTYSIVWAPDPPGPYPTFTGALAVEGLGRDDTCGLIVSGSYDSPFGRAGELFDAALGHRIASLSSRDLLHTIAAYVEHACARERAARAGRRV